MNVYWSIARREVLLLGELDESKKGCKASQSLGLQDDEVLFHLPPKRRLGF